MNKIVKFRSLGIVGFLAMIAIFSVAAMFLWNALMPEIFGLPVLTYWQTAGMVILARILFGGLGLRHLGLRSGRGGDGRLFHHGNALREKWLNMSEDERKEFLRERRNFSHLHEFFDERSGCGGKDPTGRNNKDAPGSEGGNRE